MHPGATASTLSAYVIVKVDVDVAVADHAHVNPHAHVNVMVRHGQRPFHVVEE
jgi:hypothetical protein